MARCSSLVGKKLAGGWVAVGEEKCKAEEGFGEKSRMKRQDGGDVGHGEGESGGGLGSENGKRG